ncbi:DUF4097 family beta strand repeat-containing protein [Nonomuraea sp. SBT364]|uniref:DUF4097 family beta strand repeat-containing protein n=1 Tax=Nonomuraea sp. SBT364 TaxID=1580530 RepID=UPI00066AB52E|nr:DUF4097 family beta strand repeat-containing protein [Nonomuraea sp. SBT364]
MNLRRAGAVAALLGLAAMTVGCGVVGGPRQEDTASYDVTAAVTALQVVADSGEVEVVESDRQGVHVTERLTWNHERPATTHDVQGGTLALKFTCPGGLVGDMHCEVAYKVEIPRGLRVKADSDSGEVTLRGLSGEVTASSDSGDIEATGLTGKQVVAKTDSGGISLAFASAPDKVETVSDSGRSVIRVPQGPYKITAATDSGGKEIGAAHDPSATRSIQVTTDSGDVEVLPA